MTLENLGNPSVTLQYSTNPLGCYLQASFSKVQQPIPVDMCVYLYMCILSREPFQMFIKLPGHSRLNIERFQETTIQKH